MPEFCSTCHYGSEKPGKQTYCPQIPEPIDGGTLTVQSDCRHYSCTEGLEAARMMLKEAQASSIPAGLITLFDGSVVCAYPFGTASKPFVLTSRYVNPDGSIYTSDSHGNHYRSRILFRHKFAPRTPLRSVSDRVVLPVAK